MATAIPLLDAALAAAGRLGIEGRRHALERGELLARQDSRLRGVHFLVSGLVRTSMLAENGKEILIALSGRGETIGEVEYFLGIDFVCSVRALEPSRSVQFTPAELDSLVAADPEIAKGLGRVLAGRLRSNSARIAASLAFPLEYGVLKALVGRIDGGAPAGPISKSEIAEYVGGSPRHVARVLKELEEAGIVESAGGKIVGIDPARAAARKEALEG